MRGVREHQSYEDFPQNIIGQPEVEADSGIRIGVGLEAAVDTFKLFLRLSIVPVDSVTLGHSEYAA